jgi:hypothetical protein
MFSRIRKAVLAGIVAAITGAIGAAVQKGDPRIGWPEVGAALAAGLAAGWAVWRVPNTRSSAPSR